MAKKVIFFDIHCSLDRALYFDHENFKIESESIQKMTLSTDYVSVEYRVWISSYEYFAS